MKTKRQVFAMAFYLVCTFVIAFMGYNFVKKEQNYKEKDANTETLVVYNDTNKSSGLELREVATETEPVEEKEEEIEDKEIESEDVVEETTQETIPVEPVVFEGMTLNELAAKLDRSLKSTLSGTGYIFASRSIELGIDPYLAVSIVLHETGCNWQCSTLVTQCNNVGGMKTANKCGSSAYGAFPTLEDGINSFMNNLYNNYYAVGLNTPELINTKYAESTTWAAQVRAYMERLRAA